MLYLAARTHAAAVVRLYVVDFAALREFGPSGCRCTETPFLPENIAGSPGTFVCIGVADFNNDFDRKESIAGR